jgi:hypothetical protein
MEISVLGSKKPLNNVKGLLHIHGALFSKTKLSQENSGFFSTKLMCACK